MAINYTKTSWVNEQSPAINATNLNKIEQGIKSACDGVDTLMPTGTSFIEQKTLLWTNDSPSSAFAAQTITIDGLTDYDAIEILVKNSTTENRYHTVRAIPTGGFPMISGSGYSNKIYSRQCDYVATDKLQFAASYGGSSTVSGDYQIPIKIYGIKHITA